MTELAKLRLGADTLLHLLPHRRPFLFLDGVRAFGREPRPTLLGEKYVSVNEPVFDGHFPGLALWPGVYTIEGLGQAVNVLLVLVGIVDAFERRGGTEEDALRALRELDRRRLGGRGLTDDQRWLVEQLGEPTSRVGLAGAIDVKLTEPVFAGSKLDYRVSLTRSMANARRFDVLATVDEVPVAQGSITSAIPAAFPR